MKTPTLRNLLPALVCYLVAAMTAHGQTVFQTPNIPGVGAPAFFDIGPSTGLFQIDDPALPNLPNNATALITTPAGSLTFSIGNGAPAFWSLSYSPLFPNPFLPPSQTATGAIGELDGEQFNGSFQSTPTVYADLLAGLGQFQIGSGSATPIQPVATPEPGTVALFLSGVMLMMRRSIKKAWSL